MRNFDEVWDSESADERTFQIRGEQFVLQEAVRPEALAERLSALDAVREKDDATIADVMQAIDGFVLAMIEPDGDAEERYRKVRALETGGLNAKRMQEIQRWIVERQTSLVEVETGRPTGSPRGSSAGSRRGGTSSTDSSSSPALRAVSKA